MKDYRPVNLKFAHYADTQLANFVVSTILSRDLCGCHLFFAYSVRLHDTTGCTAGCSTVCIAYTLRNSPFTLSLIEWSGAALVLFHSPDVARNRCATSAVITDD